MAAALLEPALLRRLESLADELRRLVQPPRITGRG